jgi:hypothetical protein
MVMITGTPKLFMPQRAFIADDGGAIPILIHVFWQSDHHCAVGFVEHEHHSNNPL